MYRTPPLAKLASTVHGQRRILKQPMPVLEYMRKAVETGIWRDSDEPAVTWRGDQKDPRRPHRGKDQEPNDYPLEYEILSLNPPPPWMPKVSLKLQKKRARYREKHGVLPTDRLVKSYMRRYDMRMRVAHPLTKAQREEAEYAKTLGISESEARSRMGRKSSVADHAYKFALRQYDVLRRNEDKGMTEKESVAEVERILAEEAREERLRSRRKAEEARKWREARDKLSAGGEAKAKAEAEAEAEAEAGGGEEEKEEGAKAASAPEATAAEPGAEDDDAPPAEVAASSIPSILMGKPRTIQAMTMWSRRLAAVPYNRWTVGAATALDHWIAADVLGMSEETWTNVLRGDPGEDEEIMTGRVVEAAAAAAEGEDDGPRLEAVGIGNLARAKDIVAVRSALFPETVMHSGDKDEEEADRGEEARDATQRSIDELLASLGGFDDEPWKAGDAGDLEGEEGDVDARLSVLTDELQEWRAKNVKAPFAEWEEEDKKEFNTWLSDYLTAISKESDGPVDLDATREALLSEPPRTREESEAFWSNLEDETQAEIFLQGLLAKGAPEPAEGETDADRRARENLETFLSLPYDRQLRQLVDLGTLRPVFDEYTPESERLAFLERHGEALLQGTEMEHLVPDPDGPIRAEDVGEEFRDDDDVRRGTRFRIEMKKYGEDGFDGEEGRRARELFRSWNEHKAGRAKYEEIMFKTGKLSLEDKGAKSWTAIRDKKK